VALVWTQHNLVPHQRFDGDDELYQLFADRADAVLHQSRWGRDQVERRYRFRDEAVHAVIPHGHWGPLLGVAPARADAERALGLTPCALRLGIVGAPRPDKAVLAFVRAFASTGRDDVQLLVTSLTEDELAEVPTDPRITAMPYDFVDRPTYDLRLAAIDALVFPIRPGAALLATGVVGDALATSKPALVTSWPYLGESLGSAGIPMGDTHDEWVDAVEALDPDVVAAAASAAVERRDQLDWARLAPLLGDVLDDVARPDF
jgi:glycosyltransferase involved in cell wall biosynthesis